MKYRLKKDFPIHKQGEVFETEPMWGENMVKVTPLAGWFRPTDYPDYFELIDGNKNHLSNLQ